MSAMICHVPLLSNVLRFSFGWNSGMKVLQRITEANFFKRVTIPESAGL